METVKMSKRQRTERGKNTNGSLTQPEYLKFVGELQLASDPLCVSVRQKVDVIINLETNK